MLMLHWDTPYSGLHHIYFIISANNILQLVVTCRECLTDCQDCLKSNPRCNIVSTEKVRHIITQMTSRQKTYLGKNLPRSGPSPLLKWCAGPQGEGARPQGELIGKEEMGSSGATGSLVT